MEEYSDQELDKPYQFYHKNSHDNIKIVNQNAGEEIVNNEYHDMQEDHEYLKKWEGDRILNMEVI